MSDDEDRPLTTAERQTILTIVASKGGDDGVTLAPRLAKHFEMPEETRLLLYQITQQHEATVELRKSMVEELRAVRVDMQAELRATRWQVIGVVVLALIIQAGMVGLSVTLDAGALPIPGVSVDPLGEAAGEAAMPAPAPSPAPDPPTNDDAAGIGLDTVDTGPA